MRKKILLDILPGTWLWLGHYNVSNQGSGYDSRMRRCTDEVVKTVSSAKCPKLWSQKIGMLATLLNNMTL